MTILLRGVSTRDAKITQRGLEKVGFKTIKEWDTCESYNIEMQEPEEYNNIEFEVDIIDGLSKIGLRKVKV